MTHLICCYFPFVNQLSYFSAVVWRLSVKVILRFILYPIIAYSTQFSLLLSELNPLAEHSFRFANYSTSLLWDYSAILYSPLRRTNLIQTTTSTEIDPIRSSFSAVWHISDTTEETSDHQFFSSEIKHIKVRIYFFKGKVYQSALQYSPLCTVAPFIYTN